MFNVGHMNTETCFRCPPSFLDLYLAGVINSTAFAVDCRFVNSVVFTRKI